MLKPKVQVTSLELGAGLEAEPGLELSLRILLSLVLLVLVLPSLPFFPKSLGLWPGPGLTCIEAFAKYYPMLSFHSRRGRRGMM